MPRTLSFLEDPSGALDIGRGSGEVFLHIPQPRPDICFPAPWRETSDWTYAMRGNVSPRPLPRAGRKTLKCARGTDTRDRCATSCRPFGLVRRQVGGVGKTREGAD